MQGERLAKKGTKNNEVVAKGVYYILRQSYEQGCSECVRAGILMDKTIIVEDCQKTSLLTEGSTVTATRMLGLVLLIVRNILDSSDEQQAAAVPEPMVRDVVNYAAFVITSGAPDLFAASRDLHTSMMVRIIFVPCCVVPDCMCHSVVLLVL